MAYHCLLINGSSHGSNGNSARLLNAFKLQSAHWEYRELNLLATDESSAAKAHLAWADAFVFATGTYWDGWGWPLQIFLESVTETEGSELWLGKPAAVLVTMHSVGGKGVLSRLQGVLNTFGVLLPPMSGMVVSAVGQAAMKVADESLANDIWRVSDLEIVSSNLHWAAEQNAGDRKRGYRGWQVDRVGFDDVWLDVD